MWGRTDPQARLATRRPERERGVLNGPQYVTVHYRRRRRSQSLPRRNPQVSDARAAGRVHARQAVPGA
nr:hypothetical protein [Rhizobium herbae]